MSADLRPDGNGDMVPIWTKEGWAYRSVYTPRRARIGAATSAVDRSAGWAAFAPEPPLDESRVLQAVQRALEFARPRLVLSFSHDWYVSIGGGLQSCVRNEAEAFVAAGWVYIHVCPAWPKWHLADAMSETAQLMLLTINGQRVGVARVKSLQRVLRQVSSRCETSLAVVHHLLGHSPDFVVGMIEAIGASEHVVWLHDLFSLCPSVHLLRNDAEFCFNPPPKSAVCGICSYGAEREKHIDSFRNFFNRLNPIVAAPSQTIADFWRNGIDMTFRELRIAPPASVAFAQGQRQVRGNGPIKVAFLGQPAYHKGWHAFEELARWFEGDLTYEFHILGDSNPHISNILHTPVSVNAASRTQMADAIRDLKIDVVVNWSICFESFSFTALEAVAGGAFVVARRDAGNVWPLVKSIHPNRGCAVADTDELMALFVSGELVKLLETADRRVGQIAFSRGSLDFLSGAARD